MVTQLELRHGTTVLVCWADKPVRVGDAVRLKKDDRWWAVTAAYGSIEQSLINRDWKVGGLS